MRLQCKQSEFKSTRHKIVKRGVHGAQRVFTFCVFRNKVFRQGCLIQLSWIRFTQWVLAVCMFRVAIGYYSHHHAGSLYPWWQEAMVKCMISSNLYTLCKFVEMVVVWHHMHSITVMWCQTCIFPLAPYIHAQGSCFHIIINHSREGAITDTFLICHDPVLTTWWYRWSGVSSSQVLHVYRFIVLYHC